MTNNSHHYLGTILVTVIYIFVLNINILLGEINFFCFGLIFRKVLVVMVSYATDKL